MADGRALRNLVAGLFRVTLVLVILVLAGLLIDVLLTIPRVVPDALAILGILLFGVGLVLEVLATRAFWKFGLGTPHPIDPPRNLVTLGPYRFSRNPLYVARLLILAGAAAILGSPGVALLSLCLFAGLHFFLVPREERRLVARHGSTYEGYRSQVPRWIALPWRVGRGKKKRGPGD